MSPSADVPGAAVAARTAPRCQRCGFEIRSARPMGCKNPCPNCGTIYPLGDCSD
jgi:predicted RNA-binding Zn-ribbon protein involved in translation (DUF1610 family)